MTGNSPVLDGTDMPNRFRSEVATWPQKHPTYFTQDQRGVCTCHPQWNPLANFLWKIGEGSWVVGTNVYFHKDVRIEFETPNWAKTFLEAFLERFSDDAVICPEEWTDLLP